MALSRYKIGDLICESTLKNTNKAYSLENVKGVNSSSSFCETKANMEGVELDNYKVVFNKYFAYNPSRIYLGSIAMNNGSECIVSPMYVVFYVKQTDILLPEFLFMYLQRKEFLRSTSFYTTGSVRDTFDFSSLSSLELELPSIEIQRKYVDVYLSMIENQKAYEKGLDDLKLVCDAYIEDLRRKIPCEEIGKYIKEESNRNKALKILNVQGVNSSSSFGETKADTNGLNFTNYKIVGIDQFAYNPSRINVGSIALYSKKEKCIISPMYIVFSIIDKEMLIPEYLMLWLSRKEFHRSTLYYAMGSVRDTFDFNLMKEVQIPIPDIKIQQAIVDIYKCYQKRKEINERLKNQIKDICPILIKGSIEEGK